MLNLLKIKNNWIYIIPGLVILWSLYTLRLFGPFYLTRIDPEYVYLLNGLNCATLDFNRIGHIDHPGTPFQLITGLFIRIIHLFAGQGPIVDDVITRPEFYLSLLSLSLTLLTAGILLWLGKIAIRQTENITGVLILQSSLFLNLFLIDIPSRYNPDRLLAIVVLVFSGFCLNYFYGRDYHGKKFAFQAGIILAIGFVTKFNFLPLLILPLIVLLKTKERITYLLSLSISSIILFLPVYDKFSYFKGFILSVIRHDGLYGGGSEHVFNADVFWINVVQIFRENLSFTIILGLSALTIILLVIKKDKIKILRNEFSFFIGLILTTIIGALMTAKHYKGYYIIPVISLTGFATYLLFKSYRNFIEKRYVNWIFNVLLILLIYIPASQLYKPYSEKQKNNYQNILTADFIAKTVSYNDYFLIEPTWLSGGMIENGMAYGLSYIANRNYYYNEFERYYPNALTWDGGKNPLQFLKMIDADNESILKSGKDLYVYSTPGRNAGLLCNYIDSCAKQFGISFLKDTIYKNTGNSNYIIRLFNQSTWKSRLESKCGFERFDQNSIFSDDEKHVLTGPFELNNNYASNGYHSLKLGGTFSRSPELKINNASAGDYVELTVKRKRNNHNEKGNLFLGSVSPDGKFQEIANGKVVSAIHSDWELLRLCAEVKQIPLNGILACFYEYDGNEIEFIDDLSLKHFSQETNQ